MIKIAVAMLMVIVICFTMCYMTNKICGNHADNLSAEHVVLMKEHEELRCIANETKNLTKDTNDKVTFLYNFLKSQTQDCQLAK